MESVCGHSLRYFGAVALIAFALSAPTTAMADFITLSLPPIEGDVTGFGDDNTIEVLSLTGNIMETGATVGKGRRVGAPIFSDLMIHKRLDTASPALFLALVRGNTFPKGVITFFASQTEGFTSFFTITLTNVVITTFQTDDSEMDVHKGKEQINLHYDTIALKDIATGTSACWNVVRSTTC